MVEKISHLGLFRLRRIRRAAAILSLLVGLRGCHLLPDVRHGTKYSVERSVTMCRPTLGRCNINGRKTTICIIMNPFPNPSSGA